MTIKLVGSSSGSVSLQAPATTTGGANRVLTLPDANGTVAVGDTGKILQVVQSQKVDASSITGQTFTKIPGTDQSGSGSVFCVKITPSSSSNKILFSCQIAFATTLLSYARLIRTVSGSDTVICVGTDRGNGQASFFVRSDATDHYYGSMPVNLEFLDTPNTTSEVQYSIEVNSLNSSGKCYIGRTHNETSTYGWATASTMTAREIAA